MTSHLISDLLPIVLQNVENVYQQHGELVLAAWPEIIGPKLAPMTQAVSFNGGILVVKVKNSTLHSLLSQKDKPKVMKSIKEKFPNLEIKNIVFRIG